MTTARRIIDGAGLRAMRIRATAPSPPTPTPAYIAERRAACGFGEPLDDQCEEFEDGAYCGFAIDLTGKKCLRAGRMRKFLNDHDSVCPLNLWTSERSPSE